MKLYGSLQNRLFEGKQFCEKIEVGTGVTEFCYTDRHAYEVVEVIDQNHFFIRKMIAKRIDKNYESDAQNYIYLSDKNSNKIEIVKRNNAWYKVVTFNKKMWLERAKKDESFKTPEVAYLFYKCMSGLTKKQLDRIEEGKEIKKYSKMNISIGIQEEYFDYSF